MNNFWPTQSSINSEDTESAGFHIQNSKYFESLNHQVRSIKEWGKSRDPSKRLGSWNLFWIRNYWTVHYSAISFIRNTVLNENLIWCKLNLSCNQRLRKTFRVLLIKILLNITSMHVTYYPKQHSAQIAFNFIKVTFCFSVERLPLIYFQILSVY